MTYSQYSEREFNFFSATMMPPLTRVQANEDGRKCEAKRHRDRRYARVCVCVKWAACTYASQAPAFAAATTLLIDSPASRTSWHQHCSGCHRQGPHSRLRHEGHTPPTRPPTHPLLSSARPPSRVLLTAADERVRVSAMTSMSSSITTTTRGWIR